MQRKRHKVRDKASFLVYQRRHRAPILPICSAKASTDVNEAGRGQICLDRVPTSAGRLDVMSCLSGFGPDVESESEWHSDVSSSEYEEWNTHDTASQDIDSGERNTEGSIRGTGEA
jgi:hypothetical protein